MKLSEGKNRETFQDLTLNASVLELQCIYNSLKKFKKPQKNKTKTKNHHHHHHQQQQNQTKKPSHSEKRLMDTRNQAHRWVSVVEMCYKREKTALQILHRQLLVRRMHPSGVCKNKNYLNQQVKSHAGCVRSSVGELIFLLEIFQHF